LIILKTLLIYLFIHWKSGNSINDRTRTTSCSSYESGTNGQYLQNRYKHQQGMCFLKTPKDHQIRDERIVFVSGRKAPIAIFSALPHSRRGLHNVLRYFLSIILYIELMITRNNSWVHKMMMTNKILMYKSIKCLQNWY
jgi:hypothetical protein